MHLKNNYLKLDNLICLEINLINYEGKLIKRVNNSKLKNSSLLKNIKKVVKALLLIVIQTMESQKQIPNWSN